MHIFLFPHQDDEIGVVSTLLNCASNKDFVTCFYLSTSNKGINRDIESKKFFQYFSINKNVKQIFLGSKYKIYDQEVSDNLDFLYFKIFSYIQSNFKKFDNIEILSPSFEAGHPDHDAAYFISLKLFKNFNFLKFYSFPLYNNENCLNGFFNAFSPLNVYKGQLIKIDKPKFNFLKIFLSLLIFRSQYKSLLVLSPFYLKRILLNFYLIDEMQNINFKKIEQPHVGTTYCTYRGWVCNYKKQLLHYNNFINS